MIGRFYQVEPLIDKYPWLGYVFAQNYVVYTVELEGLEAAVTIGIDEEVNFRNGHVAKMAPGAYEIVAASADDIVEGLKVAMESDPTGEVGFVAILSHGIPGKMFGDLDLDNDGYLDHSVSFDMYDVEEIIKKIKNAGIKFAENAIVFLGGCNLGTDVVGCEEGPSSFAEKLARGLGVTVVAGRSLIAEDELGQVTPDSASNAKVGYERWFLIGHFKKADFFAFTPEGKKIPLGNRIDVKYLIDRATNRLTPIKPLSAKYLASKLIDKEELDLPNVNFNSNINFNINFNSKE